MTDEQRAARGHRAASELTLTQDAFDAVREDLIRRMVETSPTETATILQFHQAIQTLGKVRHALMLVVQDGEVATSAIAIASLVKA